MAEQHRPEGDTPTDPWTENPRQPESSAEPRLERHLIEAVIGEQRRARRWGIFFKGAFLLYLVVLLGMMVSQSGDDGISEAGGDYVALVELKGVILRINSPGGSPVQSGIIHDEMQRLRQNHPDRPLYAVVTDVCASGGYYAAVGAERIYADKASVVGSIGVLFNGFGFVEAMERIGVERRLLTAGANKGFMDPFSRAKPEDRAHIQGILSRIHEQFIQVVRSGRGERLQETPELFSGLVWTGEEALELGLIDGLASVKQVAREEFGLSRVKDVTPKERWLDRLGRSIGASLGTQLLQSLSWELR